MRTPDKVYGSSSFARRLMPALHSIPAFGVLQPVRYYGVRQRKSEDKAGKHEGSCPETNDTEAVGTIDQTLTPVFSC